MSNAKDSVIESIVQQTGKTKEEVSKALDEMLENSRKGTKNDKEMQEKFKESVSGYIYVHKKPKP